MSQELYSHPTENTHLWARTAVDSCAVNLGLSVSLNSGKAQETKINPEIPTNHACGHTVPWCTGPWTHTEMSTWRIYTVAIHTRGGIGKTLTDSQAFRLETHQGGKSQQETCSMFGWLPIEQIPELAYAWTATFTLHTHTHTEFITDW